MREIWRIFFSKKIQRTQSDGSRRKRELFDFAKIIENDEKRESYFSAIEISGLLGWGVMVPL